MFRVTQNAGKKNVTKAMMDAIDVSGPQETKEADVNELRK